MISSQKIKNACQKTAHRKITKNSCKKTLRVIKQNTELYKASNKKGGDCLV